MEEVDKTGVQLVPLHIRQRGKQCAFYSGLFRAISHERIALVWLGIMAGGLVPINMHIFEGMEQGVTAMQFLQRAKNIGKVVISHSPQENNSRRAWWLAGCLAGWLAGWVGDLNFISDDLKHQCPLQVAKHRAYLLYMSMFVVSMPGSPWPGQFLVVVYKELWPEFGLPSCLFLSLFKLWNKFPSSLPWMH